MEQTHIELGGNCFAIIFSYSIPSIVGKKISNATIFLWNNEQRSYEQFQLTKSNINAFLDGIVDFNAKNQGNGGE